MGFVRVIGGLLVATVLFIIVAMPIRWVPSPAVRGWLYGVRARILGESADELYRLAERHYQAGDYEKADVLCQKALKRKPGHAPAAALLAEVRFLMGAGGSSGWVESPRASQLVRHQRALLEMDEALSAGDRFVLAGDREKAGKTFGRVLEYAKWLPEGIEVKTWVDRARASLERLPVLPPSR